MNQGGFRQFLRNLFCRVWILLIFVGEAAAGQAYFKSGLNIEVYRNSDDLICSAD